MTFEIYTDGSTKNNGYANSVGGWGYVVLQNGEKVHSNGGAEFGTTNQRMELTAAIEGIEHTLNDLCIPFDKVVVYTDSAYLHNCYTQKWYRNWERNGWVNSKKQPVANKDLWERLIKYFESPEIDFVKVKGHAGNQWNEYVDNIAQSAADSLKTSMEVK
jgi:ribonuclease HI